MTVTDLLDRLQRLDIDISYDDGQLIVEAPKGTLTEELRAEIKAHKAEVIALLQGADTSTDQQFPLSAAQNRFWFLHEFDQELAVNNLTNAFRIVGPLNVPVLERSLKEIVRRHEVLRTNIILEGGILRQLIHGERGPILDLIDLTYRQPHMRERLASDLAAEHARRPFDLTQDLLLRAKLYKIAEQEHILVITMHHMVSDGWSIGIFWRELTVLYGAYIKGETSPLPALPMQYSDYSRWQQKWLESSAMQRQLRYWQDQLAGLTIRDLPMDRPRPRFQTYDGESLWFSLPEELLAQLRLLARRENATLYMTLLAAYTVLLQRYLHQNDIALGTVAANRSHPQAENLIGPFLNTLVIRTDLGGDPTFAELLQRVRNVALDAYDNQIIPFETVLEAFSSEHDLSRTPFFQTMLVLQTTTNEAFTLAELDVEEFSLETGGSALDLSLYIIEDESESGLSGYFEFNTDLFDKSTIERMIGHFETLLNAVVADPDRSIADLPILTAEENAQLDRWNQTESDFGEYDDIVSQFYELAAHVPGETAFIYNDRHMTFGELNERSNLLARFLIRRGVSPGTRVGLAVERSLIVPVAMMAIFKAGGVYVPLDPAYPANRLHHIIKDSDITFFITTTQWREQLALDASGENEIFCLDELDLELGQEPNRDLQLRPHADDIAYIIYTSGSLGQPKGVEVAQRQVMNRLAWMWKEYPLQVNEVGCQKTALNFVDSLWEMLGYLLQGRPTVIIGDEEVNNLNLFVKILANEKVTRLWLVPSLLRAILQTQPDLQNQLPYLTFWVCSGEALPIDLARQFAERMPDGVLYNLYGTSEVWDATWYDPQKESAETRGRTVPIGRPIANMRTYILDEQCNRVPIGVPGELYVGGIGLCEGYLNRPEQTAASFFPDPFDGSTNALEDVTENRQRMYRTGDLARWLPDGKIEFLGRVDGQIKIRGIRVETEEIELLARKHDAITDAVLIAVGKDERMHLVLCVSAAEARENLVSELRDYLAAWLPRSLVPSRIIILNEIPLTPSGKVDRQALANIELDHNDIATLYIAPRTRNEAVLAEIFADLLKTERVGINEDFFDLGGHSLLGLLLIARIEKRFGRRLPVSMLFNQPTIAQIGAFLEQEEESGEYSLLVPIQSEGTRPPFFCVFGFGGSVIGYSDLVDQLGTEQPFYGLEARGLNGNSSPDETIEEMASRCIRTMRSLQTSGPYRIGGYCLGGVVAFEMARQLEEQGDSVALVAIMEGFAPVSYDESLPLMHPRRLLATWKGISFWIEDYRRLGVAKLAHKLRVKIDALGYRTRANGSDEFLAAITNTDINQFTSYQIKLMNTQIQALRYYKGGYYDGKVVLFRSGHQSITRTVFGDLDPAYGWERFARGGVDVRVVDGAHHNIHLLPHVSSLASELAVSLEEVNVVE